MAVEQGYNGWANYPTWAVNLWLGNDEPLYSETLDRVQEIAAETSSQSQYWTLAESHRFRTADMLKAWVTDDLAPDLGATFSADLLGWALAQVDWQEIAEGWLDSVQEATV